MTEKTQTPSPVEGSLEAASEERLAQLLQDLGARRGALREELGRIEQDDRAARGRARQERRRRLIAAVIATVPLG